jgi:nucleoside 2-deoxyribosyltransferase
MVKKSKMKKIYIAGPDVFKPNSIEIGKEYVRLCGEYGFKGLYPLDNKVDFIQSKNKIAQDIFKANQKLIQECDIVITNLNSFRGKESDSGTVWECGYGFGLGKKVYAYISRDGNYIDQFSKDEKVYTENGFTDLQGDFIEDFDYPLNLMLSCSVEKIIVGTFEDVLKNITQR